MPSDNDFLALEALIRSVDPERVKLPDMPIGTYLQEAEDLHVWLGPDLARLVERGLDPAVVLAEARGEEAVDREAKALRDKAYTLLKESVDEIREFGRFVFWRDEDRRLGYGSAYKRDSRSKSASRSAEPGGSGVQERPQPGGSSQMAEDFQLLPEDSCDTTEA
jgi:hypothetical protein